MFCSVHMVRRPTSIVADGPAGGAAKRALSCIVTELGGDSRTQQDARKVRAVRKQDLEKLSVCC